MKPTVSVIIPTYNRAKLLERAIRSVLSQTYRDFEIIVIDDVSTDDTTEMVSQMFREEILAGILMYVRNERKLERSATRNKGMNRSTGQFIALLDDDDMWFASHLEQCLSFLDRVQEAGCVFTNFVMFSETDGVARVRFNSMASGDPEEYRNLCVSGELLGSGSISVFRKAVLKKVGGFNETISYLEDREFFSRIAMNYRIGFIAEPSVFTYQHEGTYSMPSAEEKERVWKVIEANASKYGFKMDRNLLCEIYLNIANHLVASANMGKAKEYIFKVLRLDIKTLMTMSMWGLLVRIAMRDSLYKRLKVMKDRFEE